jgi:hypothetical protein
MRFVTAMRQRCRLLGPYLDADSMACNQLAARTPEWTVANPVLSEM